MAVLLTTVGQEYIVDILDPGSGIAKPTASKYYLAWGTGGGSHALGDTALASEATESRVTSLTITQPTSQKLQLVGTLTAGSTRTATANQIDESGILTASSSGKLILVADHAATSLASGESIQYTWGLVVQDSTE